MAEQTPNSISAPGNPIMSGTHQPLKWSVKDSDDLYNRRQAKEDWDSIKKHYPNRTMGAIHQKFHDVRAQKEFELTGTKRQRQRQRPAAKRRQAGNQAGSDTASDETSSEYESSNESYRPPTSPRDGLDATKSDEERGADARRSSKRLKSSVRLAGESLAGSTNVPASHSSPRVLSSGRSTNPVDDPTISNLMSLLSDTINARIGTAEAEKTQSQELSDAATARANRRANEAERDLRKERETRLALARSNEKRVEELTTAKLAAERTASDAQAIIESKDKRIAELERKLAAVDDGQTFSATSDDLRKTIFEKDAELAMKDQLREQISSELKKLVEAQRGDEVVLDAIKKHRSGLKDVLGLLNTHIGNKD